MTDISNLFNHIMSLINFKYYTKRESDERYMVKSELGLIIDDDGYLRIVNANEETTNGSEIYVGDVYVTRDEVQEMINNALEK